MPIAARPTPASRQPKVEACSTATRAATAGSSHGSTAARGAAAWGRAGATPSLSADAAAPAAGGASEPVRLLRELAGQHGLAELSMGTSQDYRVAVEEGATYVRVGEAVFAQGDPDRVRG